MDVKVFGQIGGWGSKKKVFGYVDVIISKITFHFNVMTVVKLLYIDLYRIMTLHTAINNTLSLTMTYYSSITHDKYNYCT